MKRCYIICAGDADTIRINKEQNDLIIAADGGLVHCQHNNIVPDIILGDFDSLGYIPKDSNTIVLPTEKDYTDSYEAVMLAMEKGYKEIVIFGAFGGERTDHTLANIALLSFISKNGGKGYIIHKNEVTTAITDSSISFKSKNSGTVSVFSFDENAIGVTEKGLKYTIEDFTLKNSVAMGVSNCFIGKEAYISVKKGTLIIFFDGTISDIL